MILVITIAFFGIGAACGAYRLLIGPGLADRVAALDVSLICLMGALAVDAARRDDTTYLSLLVVIAIIGFTATVAASRFLEYDQRRDRFEKPKQGDRNDQGVAEYDDEVSQP